MFKLARPTHHITSVLELTPDRLRELSIESLLLDVDCTLKNYARETVLPEVGEWLTTLRTEGIGLCLLSNGRGPRISRFAADVDLPFIAKALKPMPFGCRRAVRMMKFDRRKTAMVGDQLFADIMAGRLAGLTTVLVRPINPEEEPWFTQLKRPLERWVLKDPSHARE